MKVISFNINGIRARLHQLQAVIDAHQPDIIGLQEIKVHNEQFPVEAVEAMGYHVYFHGQKSHYGVAFLAKKEPLSVSMGFPTDDEDAQRRMIILKTTDDAGEPVTVLNGYFPQGENRDHPTKFPAKQKFYADLMIHLNENHSPEDLLFVIGDMNVAPVDEDIGIGEANAKRWLKDGKTSFLPEERVWIDELSNWGLTDIYRYHYPTEDDYYSWFDYRSRGFEREPRRGLRIDLIMASSSAAGLSRDSGIDYEIRGMEKPSDHCPIWAEFDIDF